MGCIDIWNRQYFGSSGLNISFTINGQFVNSVESIVPALRYDTSMQQCCLVDTSHNGSVDTLFAVSPTRKLTITERATGQVLYNQTWPAYEPNIQETNMNSNDLHLYHSICILILCALACRYHYCSSEYSFKINIGVCSHFLSGSHYIYMFRTDTQPTRLRNQMPVALRDIRLRNGASRCATRQH